MTPNRKTKCKYLETTSLTYLLFIERLAYLDRNIFTPSQYPHSTCIARKPVVLQACLTLSFSPAGHPTYKNLAEPIEVTSYPTSSTAQPNSSTPQCNPRRDRAYQPKRQEPNQGYFIGYSESEFYRRYDWFGLCRLMNDETTIAGMDQSLSWQQLSQVIGPPLLFCCWRAGGQLKVL